MKIYNYHPDTKELIGEAVADIDPLETRRQGKNMYLVPAFATAVEPPAFGVNERALFNEISNAWTVEALPAAPPAPEPPTVGEMKQAKIDLTKAEANRRIVTIVPEWKQRNLLARSQELLEKKIDGTITAQETAEQEAIRAIWTRIKAIRAASDSVEAAITALNTAGEVETKDIAADPAWPA